MCDFSFQNENPRSGANYRSSEEQLWICIWENKAIGHTKYPSADSFARMLIDLNQYVKPRLYIMDGITAMEGNGPGSGDPVAMNLILMSTDPVALDSVFARLVYLKPEMVPTNYHGRRWDWEIAGKKILRLW